MMVGKPSAAALVVKKRRREKEDGLSCMVFGGYSEAFSRGQERFRDEVAAEATLNTFRAHVPHPGGNHPASDCRH
jgi:hypothetical protein